MTDRTVLRGLASLLKGLGLFAVLAGSVWLVESLGLGRVLSTQWFDAEVRGRGVIGAALYVGLAALLTGVGVPRQAVCFFGGYAFGFLGGTALGALGSVIGCIGSLFYARLAARDFVARRFGRRIARVEDFLRRDPFLMALTIRLFPLGNNLVTNLAVGVSRIPARPFILGSALGYLPQTMVFALFGSGFELDSRMRMAVSVVLFAASTLLGVRIYRKFKAEAAEAVGDEGS